MPIKKISKVGAGDASGRKIQMATKSLYKILQYSGESGLKDARENGNFTDRTGNLRSSEGYIVTDDGKVISETGNEQVLEGSKGVSVGKSYRSELAANYGNGITLIVAAGMDYAGKVESMGKVVLSTSELKVKQMIPRLLRKAGFKVS